ncbi:conserved exported hypothetical protein [Rhodospirillaceae bacterium LM-1]|nr:conserved exported hypothetical protein [Rhodospirillaceae bacterium LM-1]
MNRRKLAMFGVAAAISFVIGYFILKPHENSLESTPSPAPQETAQTTGSEAPSTPSESRSDTTATRPEMAFDRLALVTSGNQPEACLSFTQELSDKPEIKYADYLKFQPAAQPSFKVDGKKLCLGGMSFGRDYRVTIAPGLPSNWGDKTAKQETVSISFGDLTPMVAFNGGGWILPHIGSAGVAVETVNVERVNVQVIRVNDRSLPYELKNHWNSNKLYSYAVESLSNQSGRVVWSGDMQVERRPNERVTTAFPLSEVLKERKPGAYVLVAENANQNARSNNDYWSGKAAQWVIDTDVALTALSGADGLHVMARSLANAKPMQGIRLALIAADKEELATVTTDGQGHGVFPSGLLKGKGGARPSLVMAYGQSGDFAMLDLNRPAFDLSDRGVSGRAMPGPFDVFLYSDRGIYRPGETVHLMSLLRDQQAKSVENIPLVLALVKPNGAEFRRWTLEPKAEGGFVLDFDFPATASRGLWSVQAYVDPTLPPLNRLEFDVQDFVPQKMKVTAKSPLKFIDKDKPIEVNIDGLFLYGAPAAGVKGEAELIVQADPQPFPEAKGYLFGLADDPFKEKSFDFKLDETDAKGATKLSVLLPEMPKTTLPLKARIEAALFEPGGRVVKDRVNLPIRLAPVLVGMKPLFKDGRVREGSDAIFEIQAFDAEGKPMSRKRLEYSLIREVTDYDWVNRDGRWQYFANKRDVKADAGSLALEGGRLGQIKLRPSWGRYRLTVKDSESESTVSTRFWSGWAPSEAGNETPDKVEVSSDKEAYRPGDTARLRIMPPFEGEVSVAVATDRIHDLKTLHVGPEGATVELPVRAEWGAGAYFLVSLYRPVYSPNKRDPVRAVGLAYAAIDVAPRKLGVTFATPEVVRPRQQVEVPVSVEGAASSETVYLTLAAVDEGILQLTRFKSPDPLNHYFGKRRMALDMRDDYAKLLDGNKAKAGALREGGDSLGGVGLPVVPTKTVALFAGPVKLDGSGKGRVKFDVPDFTGQLRLMSVAFGKTKLGQGESKLIVRDPVVAEVVLPRFLAPGDKARGTLMMHNVEGEAGSFVVKLKSEGSLELEDVKELTFDLPKDGRKVETFPIKGGTDGIGKLSLSLSGPGKASLDRSWPIAIRTPWRPITIEEAGALASGESFNVTTKSLDPFVPGTAKLKVNVSQGLRIDLPGLMQSLTRYPYGCTEQTVSTAMPLLYVDDESLIAESAGNGGKEGDMGLRQRVQAAVDRILDRQDEDGGVGLWQAGDQLADPWIGVYAIDFLTRAKEQGYTVSDRAITLGRNWLAQAAKGNVSFRSYWHDQRKGIPNARAYAHFVLARLKADDIGALRYMHDVEMPQILSPLARAQLGAALAIMGDRTRAESAFNEAEKVLNGTNGWGDYYASPLRNLAGMTAAAYEAGSAERGMALAAKLETAMKPSDQLNTQEKLWLVLAAQSVSKKAVLKLAVNGDAVPAAKPGPKSLSFPDSVLRKGVLIANKDDKPVWRSVVTNGVPKEAPPVLSQGVGLTKKVLSLNGEPVALEELRQNDRVIVVLEGATGKAGFRQLVLVDMLPAGLEIEGPVLANADSVSDAYPWLGAMSRARMREARDDRFVAAFNVNESSSDYNEDSAAKASAERASASALGKGWFRTAYIARAITLGSFIMPGAVVEDMYQPQTMAVSASHSLTVAPPK